MCERMQKNENENQPIGLCPVLMKSNVCLLLIPSNVANVVFADNNKLWKV